MKRLVVFILVLALLLLSSAEATTIPSLASMTLEELQALRLEIDSRIQALSLPDAEGYVDANSYDGYARNPSAHIDEKIKFNGEVIQVIETDEGAQYRIAVGGDSSKIFFVQYLNPKGDFRILQDDKVTVYGIFRDLVTYESTMGGHVTIPACDADLVTSQIENSAPAGKYQATRNDPVPLGFTATFPGEKYGNTAVVDVTMMKAIRGTAAYAVVKGFNRYNDKPSSGKEYLLVSVKTDVKKAPDGKATISSYDFKFVSRDGVEYESAYIYKLEPELHDLYEGASQEAYIVCLVKTGDKPLIVYESSSDHSLWFDPNVREVVEITEELSPLKSGAKSPEVTRMQDMLIEMGFLASAANGKYDSATKKAVSAYQKAMGLKATGTADVVTLKLILGGNYPSR